MKTFRPLLLTGCALLALTGISAAQTTTAATADTTPPSLTIATPAVGLRTKASSIVVTGTATDTGGSGSGASKGVKELLYRIDGSSRWKKALLSSPAAASGTGAGASAGGSTFAFNLPFKGRKSLRFYVRATDAKGNESDTIGRKVTYGSVPSATTVAPTTGTGTNTGTNTGNNTGTNIGTITN